MSATSAVILAGCASMQAARHNYIMRGSILEVTDDTAYLCIGSADGAQVGQEFTVYKFHRVSSQRTGGYERINTGRVRITEIVDEHMANAKIISGEAKVNYIVELN